jgi:hypothetical protein
VNTARLHSESLGLPYRIRRPALRMDGLGVSRQPELPRLIAAYFPWHGVALALTLVVGWTWFVDTLAPSLSPRTAILSTTALALASILADAAFRRDTLTTCGVERRSGLLGRRAVVIPYSTINSVTVEEQRYESSPFDVGDVLVATDQGVFRLVAVLAPRDVASLIQKAVPRCPRPDA